MQNSQIALLLIYLANVYTFTSSEEINVTITYVLLHVVGKYIWDMDVLLVL